MLGIAKFQLDVELLRELKPVLSSPYGLNIYRRR
jgi:hypothetical protein